MLQINGMILLFGRLFVLKDDLDDNTKGFQILFDLGLQIYLCNMERVDSEYTLSSDHSYNSVALVNLSFIRK